jgi:catechol 2,3-dioxygenase-like lactoylglutathione lyase family enzyme
MLDHISLAVSDIAKSRAFFDKALAPLGAVRKMDFGEGTGYITSGYGTQAGRPVFWIGAAVPAAPAGAPPNGQHVAFHAETRAAVDAFYRGHGGGRRG